MLLRIFILLLVLIIFPPIFMDRFFIKPLHKKHLRLFFFLPNIAMLLAAILLTCFETYTPQNALATNLFLTIFLGYVVTLALLSFFFVIAHFVQSHHLLSRGLYVLGVVAAIFNIYVIITGISYGKYHIVVRQIVLSSPDLPDRFNGYRIVQLSDFHLGTYRHNPRFVRRVVRLVNEQHADLVAFTGDLVNYNAHELDPFMPLLHNITAKDGVFSIMGNHDYMTYYKWKTPADQRANIHLLVQNERRMGWNLLLNQNHILHRDSDSMAIVGVENDGLPPFPQHGDLKKALHGVPHSLHGKPFFKILLSHDPSYWHRKVLPDTDIQLTLAGHTHGGQFKIFHFAPLSLLTAESAGLYHQGQRKLYVSTGLGEALLTFRYGVWPQIDVITLQKTAL
jgi:predicted MPP superfamily phosphohydrolase